MENRIQTQTSKEFITCPMIYGTETGYPRSIAVLSLREIVSGDAIETYEMEASSNAIDSTRTVNEDSSEDALDKWVSLVIYYGHENIVCRFQSQNMIGAATVNWRGTYLSVEFEKADLEVVKQCVAKGGMILYIGDDNDF